MHTKMTDTGSSIASSRIGRYSRASLTAALLCLITLYAAPAWGQVYEEAKLIASDGNIGGGEWFGGSVGVSGNVAVVGAAGDDDNGYRAGAAYIFDYDPVSMTWSEDTKILPDDGGDNDYFGHSVAISQVWAVLGAENSGFAGSAYVYRDNGVDWYMEEKLEPSDGEVYDCFGCSVAITTTSWERYIIVGNDGDDDNGDESGSAYVFKYEAGGVVWKQKAKIRPSDGGESDRFGCAVSMTGGDLALVGANYDSDVASYAGSAYIFRRQPGSEVWMQEAKLVASDAAEHQKFGSSVSISGDVAVVGAPGILSDKGAAYIFRYDSASGSWYEETKLQESMDQTFGESVSISGDMLVVGVLGSNYREGKAYLYQYDSLSEIWTEKGCLMASDGHLWNDLGCSVSISGETILVGAVGDSTTGVHSGSAYVFDATFFGLSINPNPPVSGQGATISAFDGEPFTSTWLVCSTTGVGSTPYPPLNIVLALDRPRLVPGTSGEWTNAEGNVEWSLIVPASVAGMTIWFQAAQQDKVTNVISTTVQ